jgi:hypothetical protein
VICDPASAGLNKCYVMLRVLRDEKKDIFWNSLTPR